MMNNPSDQLQSDQFGDGYSQMSSGESVHLTHEGKPSAYGTSHPIDVALGRARRARSFKTQAVGEGSSIQEDASELHKVGNMRSSPWIEHGGLSA